MYEERQEVRRMARCEVRGNDYDLFFEVTMAGLSHVFDSFERAIYALAPICEHCGVRVIGHGAQADGALFCGAHCAREVGKSRVRVHV